MTDFRCCRDDIVGHGLQHVSYIKVQETSIIVGLDTWYIRVGISKTKQIAIGDTVFPYYVGRRLILTMNGHYQRAPPNSGNA